MGKMMYLLMVWLLAVGGCNSLCDPGHPSILCPSDLSDSCPSTGDGTGGDGTGDDGAGGDSSDDGSGGLGGATGATTDPGNTTDPGPTTDPDPGARRPPRVARRHRPHRWRGERLGTAVSADCPGEPVNVPPPPSSMPNWQPLTTAKLRWIAKQNNVGNSNAQSGIQQSRTIGLAFETWALTTIGLFPKPPGPGRNTASFMSQARQNANNGLPASVIPEFVGDQSTTQVDIGAMSIKTVSFPRSAFVEVKAVTAPITLGTSQSQILGLIDVANVNTKATAPAGPHPPPLVFFITTGGTTVASDVVNQGLSWKVAVWQQTASYDANSANANNPDLRLEKATCLTPSLYATLSSYSPNPGATSVSVLTSPATPPMDLVVSGDPDPAEVD